MALTAAIAEVFGPVAKKTYTTSAAVTAARMVAATAGSRRVGPAGAGSLRCRGVSMHTASAAEDKVTVARTGTFKLRASGAIVAGDRLECAANGEVRIATTVDAAGSFDPRAIVAIAEEDASTGTDFLATVIC